MLKRRSLVFSGRPTMVGDEYVVERQFRFEKGDGSCLKVDQYVALDVYIMEVVLQIDMVSA